MVSNGLESDGLSLILLLAVFAFLYMKMKHLTFKELWEKVREAFRDG
jgi:hypothetical protein